MIRFSFLLTLTLPVASIQAGESKPAGESSSLRGTGTPSKTPDPAALIRQLASEKYAEREAATHALDALGPKALPALFKALDGPLEVSQRAKKLIHKIQERQFLDDVRKPRLIQWDIKDRSIGEVLEEAQKNWNMPVYLRIDRGK